MALRPSLLLLSCILLFPDPVLALEWPLSITSNTNQTRSFWTPTAGLSFYGAPSVYGGVMWGNLRQTKTNDKGALIRVDIEAGFTEGRVMVGSGYLIVEKLVSSKELEAYATYVRLGVLQPWRNSRLDRSETYWGAELVVQAVGFSRSYFGFTDFVPLALSVGFFSAANETEPRVALSYGL